MMSLRIWLGSFFAFPYPFAHLLNDAFLDRSPDGQCLILSSRDGYCTIVIFDEILTPFHTQQQTLQLQSIAHHHSVPITYANPTPMPTPSSSSASLPHTTPPNVHVAKRRVSEAASSSSLVGAGEEFGQGRLSGSGSGRKSFGGDVAPAASSLTRGRKEQDEEEAGDDEEEPKVREPPKKKRRVVLTKVGDIDNADGR
jgi:chromatin assembly factor 1 subunit B